MNILAIESSCDETAVAIVRDGREVLTDCISSQVELHKLYGGVVPEIASRKHIEAIYGLAEQALATAKMTRGDIDAIAVTYAPGLIGAVLVGVNFAKGAAMSLGVPLVPVIRPYESRRRLVEHGLAARMHLGHAVLAVHNEVDGDLAGLGVEAAHRVGAHGGLLLGRQLLEAVQRQRVRQRRHVDVIAHEDELDVGVGELTGFEGVEPGATEHDAHHVRCQLLGADNLECV